MDRTAYAKDVIAQALPTPRHRQPAAFWDLAQVRDSTDIALYRRQTREMNQARLVSASRRHELVEEAELLSMRLNEAVLGGHVPGRKDIREEQNFLVWEAGFDFDWTNIGVGLPASIQRVHELLYMMEQVRPPLGGVPVFLMVV
jgi:hypothetical protein